MNTVESAGYVRTGMITVAMISAAVLVWLSFMPISTKATDLGNESIYRLPSSDFTARDIDALVRKIAGRRLIEPSQVQAAVKDTGAAERLVKELNLQGVVNLSGSMVAYIGVRNGTVHTVREGDKILQFVVKSIRSARVTLSLDGVDVELTH